MSTASVALMLRELQSYKHVKSLRIQFPGHGHRALRRIIKEFEVVECGGTIEIAVEAGPDGRASSAIEKLGKALNA